MVGETRDNIPSDTAHARGLTIIFSPFSRLDLGINMRNEPLIGVHTESFIPLSSASVSIPPDTIAIIHWSVPIFETISLGL